MIDNSKQGPGTQTDIIEHRLKMIHPKYVKIYREVKKTLVHLDVTDSIKNFVLTDHEFDVLHALEWLLNKDFPAFLNYDVDLINKTQSDIKVQEITLNEYATYASEYESVLRWTMLLHDLAKGRDDENTETHPKRGADVVQLIQLMLWGNRIDFSEQVVWLIRYHDVLGNIYTGERFPSFLLKIGEELSHNIPEIMFRLLQIVTLCDVRGTVKGKYLTNSKARYWSELSSKTNIMKLDAEILNWRIRRWTGDLLGVDDETQVVRLYSMIENSPEGRLIKEAFGVKIDYIVYGFYLFVQLSTAKLFTLMQHVSAALQDYSPPHVTLKFDIIFRPGDEQVLDYYNEQIGNSNLNFTIDDNLNLLSLS